MQTSITADNNPVEDGNRGVGDKESLWVHHPQHHLIGNHVVFPWHLFIVLESINDGVNEVEIGGTGGGKSFVGGKVACGIDVVGVCI